MRGGHARPKGLVPVEGHQRAHRHAKLPNFVSAAKIRQIDNETGGEHLGTHLS